MLNVASVNRPERLVVIYWERDYLFRKAFPEEHMHTVRRLLFCLPSAVYIGLATQAAILQPRMTGSQVAEPWLEAKSSHYSVFFQKGYENDAEFARHWMDHTEQLMRDKYGVAPEHYSMSVYLHPTPIATASVGLAQNRCCTRGQNGISVGTIDLLAPSAAAWKESDFKSSLGMPKNDESYHAKILVSEYIPIGHYAVQDARPNGGWRYYSAPEWFVQGLQEYDAIFHTTGTNRAVTVKRLFEWAKKNSNTFACCSPKFEISDVYNGGATFVAFLAAEFGEDIHARLLRNGAQTFEVALADETKPYTSPQLFEHFQKWLAALK